MELAAHWHRCQNLSKKRMNTSPVYREKNDPVKDGLADCRAFLRIEKPILPAISVQHIYMGIAPVDVPTCFVRKAHVSSIASARSARQTQEIVATRALKETVGASCLTSTSAGKSSSEISSEEPAMSLSAL